MSHSKQEQSKKVNILWPLLSRGTTGLNIIETIRSVSPETVPDYNKLGKGYLDLSLSVF